MRSPGLLTLLIAVLLAVGCDADERPSGGQSDAADSMGGGDGDASVCGEFPPLCTSKCRTQTADFDVGDCCDSTTCNCNPTSTEWEIHYCHMPQPDAGPATSAGAGRP